MANDKKEKSGLKKATDAAKKAGNKRKKDNESAATYFAGRNSARSYGLQRRN